MAHDLYHSQQYPSLTNLPSKVSSSQGTDASQPLVLGKHLSLISCASSLSIEENIQESIQCQLFARYLFASDQKRRVIHFQEMRNHFMELLHTEPERIKMVLELQMREFDEEGRILSHFIDRWLQFMGYGSSKNRRYFISRIKLLIGDSKAHKFAKIYSNLHLLGLSTYNLLQFLLQTCRNGWQYFIRELHKLEANAKVSLPL